MSRIRKNWWERDKRLLNIQSPSLRKRSNLNPRTECLYAEKNGGDEIA